MFCSSCGKELSANSVVCTHCGVDPFVGKHYCNTCGSTTADAQTICVKCGCRLCGSKNKIIAGFLAICLGGIGAHKFYHGSWGWGLVFLVTCWTYVPTVVSFVESIIYFSCNRNEYDIKYNRLKSDPFKW